MEIILFILIFIFVRKTVVEILSGKLIKEIEKNNKNNKKK